MASWVPTLLALAGVFAILCLLAAGGRAVIRRRMMHRRLADFLIQQRPAPSAAAAVVDSPTLREQAMALLRSSNRTVVLMAVGGAGALISLLIGWTPGLVLAIVAFAAGGILALRGENRRDQIEQQLGPVLLTLAAAMESGYSVLQALERAVHDSPEPIAGEFAQTLRAIELGTSLEEAVTQLAERVGGENMEFFANVTAMQYRIGGDLPSLLTSLATRIQERMELKAEMQALTAQARYSGWVLTALPFGVVGVLLLASPSYLAPLVSTAIGRNVVLFAITLLVAGLATIREISRVEV